MCVYVCHLAVSSSIWKLTLPKKICDTHIHITHTFTLHQYTHHTHTHKHTRRERQSNVHENMTLSIPSGLGTPETCIMHGHMHTHTHERVYRAPSRSVRGLQEKGYFWPCAASGNGAWKAPRAKQKAELAEKQGTTDALLASSKRICCHHATHRRP